MTIADAPRTELGYPGGIVPALGPAGGLGAGFYLDGLEVNADLRFPASSIVYDRMRKEDGQVGSVMRAITLPIRRTRWRLAGDEVRPAVKRFVEGELGLDVEPGRARRRRQGIVWAEHLREALLALPFGFMPFEQVYDVGRAAPGREDPDDPNRLYAHLRKLAPRMPRTLTEVRVGRDGGLAGLVQAPAYGYTIDPRGVFLPVDRLVVYVNDREGADWTGNSVLRSAYKHWLIKDALIRLGAQVVERNGMGIPFVEYDNEGQRGQALAIAKNLRAGAEAGAALPTGIRITIAAVAGNVVDGLPWVKYHDEAIGRSLLAMFLNLGHDNGARALGDTFVSIFRDALGAVIADVEETATEHIIRDLVELNYGPDEPYPTLKADALSEEATAEALKALTDAHLLTPDDALEEQLRRRYGLPAIDAGTARTPPDDGTPVEIPVEDTVVGPDESLEDRLERIYDKLTALRAGR